MFRDEVIFVGGKTIQMGSIIEIGHSVVRHYLSIARDKNSNARQFHSAVGRLSVILACETTRSLAGTEFQLETPLETTSGFKITQSVGLVPILRAGLALVESHVNLLPDSKVFHLGMYRDEETPFPVSKSLEDPLQFGRIQVRP